MESVSHSPEKLFQNCLKQGGFVVVFFYSFFFFFFLYFFLRFHSQVLNVVIELSPR